jgi:uncharacterized linocin/CFP29 family protein
MPSGNSRFSWDEARWTAVNTVIHNEMAALRRARLDEGSTLPETHSGRLFALFGPQDGSFIDDVKGYKVHYKSDRGGAAKRLSIAAGQNLVPAKIWVRLELSPEQFNDENAAIALTTKAADQLEFAEEQMILHGATAKNELDKLNVSYEYLDRQEGLFKGKKAVHKSILETIINGIEELRERNFQGEYCVVVSPDLYREAFAPRKNTMDAPIYEIRPLLKKNGFVYSPAAQPKTGVIFSLGGRTIDLAVPVDARAELDDEEGGVAILRVVEQLRLRVNDEDAVVTLGEAKP